LGGRPRLSSLILCMKVDARYLLATVCPAQKQNKPLTFLLTSMSSTQSTERKSSTGMSTKSFWLRSEIHCLNKEAIHQLYFLIMFELFKIFQLLEIEEKGSKLPVSTSLGGRPGMHRQVSCKKVWILGLCFPKWFQHRGKSRPGDLVWHQTEKFGGPPLLATSDAHNQMFISFYHQSGPAPDEIETCNFPLDWTCPVTNPKEKNELN